MPTYYVELFDDEQKSIHSFKLDAKNSSDMNSKIETIMQSSPWKHYGRLTYKASTYEN